MKVEQLYTGCIAEAAYYIESEGEVAIIDPLRETQPYIDMAEKNGAKIKYIFETHFHADFVSGHIDLANKTGAEIIYGPTANAGYEILVGSDNQEFKLGDVTIKLLHTPGHTQESSTYLLIDEHGNNHAIFTGDTLFLGDVGRPDLAVKTALSQEDLAGMLYDSLRNKIMTLEDNVIVYPGHGAGSACGKNMSKETIGTLGEQKQSNYALRADMTKEEFVEEVTTGLVTPPQYFPKNAVLNKQGYESIDDVLKKGNKGLTLETFITERNKGALVLDVRSQQEFVKGHVPNSMFIGLDGNFAMWVGALIEDIKQPIILIAPEGREEEAVIRLARVGYDNSLGYLEGGIKTWKTKMESASLESISPKEFEAINATQKIAVIDVRKVSEYEAHHVVGAKNYPLDTLTEHMDELSKEQKYYVHCAGGYRSLIALSMMKAKGFTNIVNVEEGFKGIEKHTDIKLTEYICPSTLL